MESICLSGLCSYSIVFIIAPADVLAAFSSAASMILPFVVSFPSRGHGLAHVVNVLLCLIFTSAVLLVQRISLVHTSMSAAPPVTVSFIHHCKLKPESQDKSEHHINTTDPYPHPSPAKRCALSTQLSHTPQPQHTKPPPAAPSSHSPPTVSPRSPTLSQS